MTRRSVAPPAFVCSRGREAGGLLRSGLALTALLSFACSTANGTGSAIRGAGAASDSEGGGLNLGGASNRGGSGTGIGDEGINVPSGGMDSSGGGALAGTSCDGKLTGYIRDFLAARSPDFEPFDMQYPNRMPGKKDTNTLEAGIVQASLGADKKPVYALGDGTTVSLRLPLRAKASGADEDPRLVYPERFRAGAIR